MEGWQKELIKKNLPKLIKNTTCNSDFRSEFVAAGEISQQEMNDLISNANPGGQATQFYDIIQKRCKSFDLLIRALHSTSQSGAHDLLSQLRKVESISYWNTKLIGKGCYGTQVHRGIYDTRDVAVKIINTGTTEKKTARGEVDLLRELGSSDNIVKYLKTEETDDYVLIAFELCDTNLPAWIKNQQSIPIGVEEEVLLQVAEGVKFLHSYGIIHGDLRPANILIHNLPKWGKVLVKISDFGTSKKIPTGSSVSITPSLAGLEVWSAPEVVRDVGKKTEITPQADLKADIFSLGCIFYYVLTGGLHPFGNEGLFITGHNILEGRSTLEQDKFASISVGAEGYISLIKEMIAQMKESRHPAPVVCSRLTSVKNNESVTEGVGNKNSQTTMAVDAKPEDAGAAGATIKAEPSTHSSTQTTTPIKGKGEAPADQTPQVDNKKKKNKKESKAVSSGESGSESESSSGSETDMDERVVEGDEVEPISGAEAGPAEIAPTDLAVSTNDNPNSTETGAGAPVAGTSESSYSQNSFPQKGKTTQVRVKRNDHNIGSEESEHSEGERHQKRLDVVKRPQDLPRSFGRFTPLERQDRKYKTISSYIKNGSLVEGAGLELKIHQILELAESPADATPITVSSAPKRLLWWKTTPGSVKKLERQIGGCIAFVYDVIARAFAAPPSEFVEPVRQTVLLCSKLFNSPNGFRYWVGKELPRGNDTIRGTGKFTPDPAEDRVDQTTIIPSGKLVEHGKFKKYDLDYNEYLIFDASRAKVRYAVDVEVKPERIAGDGGSEPEQCEVINHHREQPRETRAPTSGHNTHHRTERPAIHLQHSIMHPQYPAEYPPQPSPMYQHYHPMCPQYQPTYPQYQPMFPYYPPMPFQHPTMPMQHPAMTPQHPIMPPQQTVNQANHEDRDNRRT